MNTYQLTLDTDSTTAVADPIQPTAGNGSCTPENGYDSVGDEDCLGNDDDEDPEYKNLAIPLFDFITQRVSELKKEGPTDLMDFSDFKAFWRDKFDQMRFELVLSHESQLFITDPPLKELEIEILDYASERGCPCCLDFTDAQIVVRAEQGITRDVFLEVLKDHLYGEDVKSEDLRLSDRHHGMLIQRDWNYMVEEEDVFYKGSEYSMMRIWMYCSDRVVLHR